MGHYTAIKNEQLLQAMNESRKHDTEEKKADTKECKFSSQRYSRMKVIDDSTTAESPTSSQAETQFGKA